MLELQLHHVLSFLAPPLASATVVAALHWFPGARYQPPLVRYVLGTLVTVGVPVTAMCLTVALGLAYGSLFWAALLVVNALVAGATTAAAYWIDELHRQAQPLSLDELSEAHYAETR